MRITREAIIQPRTYLVKNARSRTGEIRKYLNHSHLPNAERILERASSGERDTKGGGEEEDDRNQRGRKIKIWIGGRWREGVADGDPPSTTLQITTIIDLNMDSFDKGNRDGVMTHGHHEHLLPRRSPHHLTKTSVL